MTATRPTPRALAVVPTHGRPGRVAADLTRLWTDLESAARRLRAGDDRDAAHDLRVAARRLAAGVGLWRELAGRRRSRRLIRGLRRMRRDAGTLRDREVARALLLRLEGALPARARPAAAALAGRLGRRIARGARHAARDLDGRRFARLRRRLARALRRLAAANEGLPRVAGAATMARDRIAAREQAAAAALAAAVASGEDTALHQARIAVKHWRYGLERLAAVAEAGDGADETLAHTRALQRALGRLQDLAGLRQRVERRAARLAERERAADADALRAVLPVIERERAAPLAAVQRLVSTRSAGRAEAPRR